MDINDIKLGDILDVYKEGETTCRVIIYSRNEDDGLVFGITKYGRLIDIDPNRHVEKVLINIDDLT